MPVTCPTTDLDASGIDPYTMTPVGKKLLLRLIPQSETTDGGLILADDQSDPVEVGTVIARGRDTQSVLLGTHLQFAKYAPGMEFTKGDERFKLVAEHDLIGSVTLPS